jgi:hypothetical protein
MAVGELCGRGQAIWPWVSCIPLVNCVAVDELCGRGQAVWPWASYVVVDKLYTAGELYAAGELCCSGELCGGGQAMWRRGVPPQKDDDRPYGYHYTITGLEVSPVGLPAQVFRQA